MACFDLVDCSSTIMPPVVMWTTDTPALTAGTIITCNEVPGHCLLVVPTGNPAACFPSPYNPISGVLLWPDCQTCYGPLCACPQGTTLVTLPNGTQVCRLDTTSPALAPNTSAPFGCEMVAEVIGCATCAVGTFVQQLYYNQFGAIVYQDISSYTWPVSLLPVIGCTTFNFIDASTNVASATNNNSNPLWGDGLSLTNGRHNNSAVWNKFWAPSTCPTNPLLGFYGFTYCLTVTTLTTYYFAASGQLFRLRINGAIAVENNQGNPAGTSNLHIFPITLYPGTYILELSGGNGSGSACSISAPTTVGFAWEIYSGPGLTSSSLMAMTTTVQLAAVTVYSTVNELGNKFDYSTQIYLSSATLVNHSCLGAGQALDNCFTANPNVYVCHSYQDFPLTGCCYLLTNCDPLATPSIILTSTNLGAQLGNVITVMPSIAGTPSTPGCFIVSLAPACDGTEIPVIMIQSFGPSAPPNNGCIACAPKCYLLTDCEGILPSFIVNNDLSAFVNPDLVISYCPPGVTGKTNGTNNFTCCLTLTDCCNPANVIRVPCAPNGLYVNQVINIPSLGNTCWQTDAGGGCLAGTIPVTPIIWANENVTVHQSCAESPCPNCGPSLPIITQCTCFTVSLAQSCVGSITLPGTIVSSSLTCAECLPKCFFLEECGNPNNTLVTDTDLTLYLGQIIYIDGCPGVCWVVSTSITCVGAVPVVVNTTFIDCNTCLNIPPPPPLELKPRAIKPGYYTAGCDPEYTENVSCTFANAVYDHMVISRYGITMCCNEPIEKWDIKMQLLELRAIYDPELCKNTICKCLPPCGMVAQIITYGPYTTCTAPTGMSAVLVIPPTQCLAPSGIQSVITITPVVPPCICYSYGTSVTPAVIDYISCLGNPVQINTGIGIPGGYFCGNSPAATPPIVVITPLPSTNPNCMLLGC